MKTDKYTFLAIINLFLLPLGLRAQENEAIELEAFIAEETALEDSDSLMPTDMMVDGAFFSDMELLDTPRAVTTLSPEALKQFQINDFSDLSKVAAGTERQNFYGIAGSPFVRGWQGGLYFNGMLRAFQRNEMPTSFGSLEAMEIVKGPAPSQFVPTHVGGYANLIPKSPYFDEFRGSLNLEIGTNQHYKLQGDVGGPILLTEKMPAAFRISVTGQQANSFYDDVSNDYISFYGAIKVKLSDTLRIFTGAEYYNFNSNENPGWNRPTQNLIDNGQYVIGEPLSMVRAANGGVADRNLIDGTVFGFGPANNAAFRALVVPDAIITTAIADGTITAAQRDLMLDMSDATTRDSLYAGFPADTLQTTSGFVYTPEYFQAGGTVFTAPIEESTALADPADFADSEDFLYFIDLTKQLSDKSALDLDILFERISTRKRSSYGYSFDSHQFITDIRAAYNREMDFDGILLQVSAGAEGRLSKATQLQDFWTEPFARRDITQETISSNSVILSGSQTDPIIGGNNYWGGGFGAGAPGGHAVESDVSQLAAFVTTRVSAVEERANLIFAIRGERANITSSVPPEPTDIAPGTIEDDITYLNWSVNPSFRVMDGVSIYGSYQKATTYVPTQGGAVLDSGNFGDAVLREGGVKTSLVEGKLYASVSYYEWEQSSFNERTSVSDQFESEGVEVEVTYQPLEWLTFIASFSDRETRKVNNLGFRTIPFSALDPTGSGNDEIGLALEAGSLANQFSVAASDAGFSFDEASRPSANSELIVPGFPERTYKGFLLLQLPFDITAGISVRYNEGYFHNYDRTLEIDDYFLVDLNFTYETDDWEIYVAVENVTSTRYFTGADPEFAANTLVAPGADTEAKLGITYKF